MRNNFIELTDDNGRKISVNSTLIESLVELEDKTTLIRFGFGSSVNYYVTETIKEINKLIEKSNYFTTITK